MKLFVLFLGVANVREAMQRLLHEGHKVLYKQLLNWILQGNLYDPFEEFFVKSIENNTNNHLKNGESVVFNAEDEGDLVDKQLASKFQLKMDMIPCHVSVSTAEKIFFIGESIQLFERDRNIGTNYEIYLKKLKLFYTIFSIYFTFIDARGGVLKDKEAEFYNQLAELSESLEFRVADFERFVDTVRETASRHLHTLVLVNADLRNELDILRSFFLLRRGELFQTFIEDSDSYLQVLC